MLSPIASGLLAVFNVICQLIYMVVLASIIISWVNADPNNRIVQAIYNITEPLYRPFRKLTANLPGPIDWSPLIILLILLFVQEVASKAARQFGL